MDAVVHAGLGLELQPRHHDRDLCRNRWRRQHSQRHFSVVVQDTTAPTVSITGGPTGTVGSASASITFGTNEGTLTCALDGGSYSPCSSPANLTGLSAGAHTFHVQATDAATNVGNASRSWTVDTSPPTFTAPSEVSVEANSGAGSVVSFVVTAADDGVPLLPGR